MASILITWTTAPVVCGPTTDNRNSGPGSLDVNSRDGMGKRAS
jgi:hypothetical protein